MMQPAGKKWLLAATAMLAMFVAGEVAVRLIHPAQHVTGTLPVHPEQGLVYRETPSGRRLQPNLDVTIEHHALNGRTIRLRTNRQGFRGPDIGDKQGTRILFLGDSITFADYLPEQETFVRRIESMARQDGRGWETINAGVGAIDTRTELAILMEQGLLLKPDMVVLCHYLNDFLPSPALLPGDVPAFARRSHLATRLWLATTASRRIREQAQRMAAAETDFRVALARDYTMKGSTIPPIATEALRWFGDWGGAWSPQAWELTRPQIELFANLARKHGFTPRVVSFPSAPQVYLDPPDDYPQQQLATICRNLDIPMLDLLPVLRAEARRGTRLFYDQCHHTPEGSQVVAGAIYTFLTARD